MTKNTWIICENFLFVLDRLNITDEHILPTEALVRYISDLYKIEEGSYEAI